jgi:hypothetical protein
MENLGKSGAAGVAKLHKNTCIIPRDEMSGRPIRPDEIQEPLPASPPPAVFDAFNELIAKNMQYGGVSHVLQEDAVHLILQRIPDATKDIIFKKGWLDVEETYRAAGWRVKYARPCMLDDSPGFPPYFEFSKRP